MIHARAVALVAVLAASGGAAHAQPTPPRNNFDVAVNGMFRLCPALVRGQPSPDGAVLAAMGLTAVAPGPSGDQRFMGLSQVDQVRIDLEAAAKRCTVNYGGAGFKSVAGAARALVMRNGLSRLTGGTENRAVVDVYEGPAPGSGAIGRFIIIENAASNTAAISYTERAGH